MQASLLEKKDYKLLLCKLVKIDEEYDHLHFYIKLEHQGKELEFCIQFADLYDAYSYTQPGLRHYIEKYKEENEFIWDCDEALLDKLQEDGMTLEQFVTPLFDEADIMQLWKHTTGKILGKDAGLRNVTKAEWKAYYEAIDQYEYVPELHIASNDIKPSFYKAALRLAFKHYPALKNIPSHWKREIRLKAMEYVADCWSFYEMSEFYQYEKPAMPTNEFEETKEEMYKNMRGYHDIEEQRVPVFCLEVSTAAHQWEVVGENSMLIGYKVTTATGYYYSYQEMGDLEDEARLEFPELFDIIWEAKCAVKGVSPKQKETYDRLASQGFDWTPLLVSYIWKYEDIKCLELIEDDYKKHENYEPEVPESLDRLDLGDEAEDKIPHIQNKWRLYDDLVKLMDKTAHKEFPALFDAPLNGGYWYYHYHHESEHAKCFADFCCEMVFAVHNLGSDYWPRYE